MRTTLTALVVVALQLADYHTIGKQPFCNESPSDRVLQCNYESADACLAYLENGQHCVTNLNYMGDIPGHQTIAPDNDSTDLLEKFWSRWERSRKT